MAKEEKDIHSGPISHSSASQEDEMTDAGPRANLLRALEEVTNSDSDLRRSVAERFSNQPPESAALHLQAELSNHLTSVLEKEPGDNWGRSRG